MKEERVLYQIKTLEKLIARTFINEDEMHSMQAPTPTQVQIMEYILEHQNDEVYQKDLEKVLNLRRATVSGVLQTMEKHELLERETTEKDARTKKIVLNNKAKQIFNVKKKKIEKLEQLIIQDIPVSELDIFFDVINKMIKNVKNNINKQKGDKI